ncbi:hypothetical protein AVEN_83442-1 [Araneus ventricosus]|uniref:Uncharacterized protein n=1 Tax=Araneus ventricosus TaxID=182803 RepID=A0A4Y2N3E3_ARAVE|nr:hypothetical protein AVEN_83442-1 [Araneus ventricosus]
MVKNELRLLQGDIKDFKKERHSLLLQIQEKNKYVENLKSDNDSLVKMNAYYHKKKSGRFVREISWQLEEILTRQVNQQRRNHDTEVPWLSQKYSLVIHIESHN